MPTPDGKTFATSIRVRRAAHTALEEYADEVGVSYSSAVNLFLLKGLLADGRITEVEYRAALIRPTSVTHKLLANQERTKHN